MTVSEINNILENEPKHLIKILNCRNEENIDEAILYVKNEFKCSQKNAEECVTYIIKLFSNVKPIEKTPQITCPYCKSTDTKKITLGSKVAHTAVFGLFSISRNSKNYHCNSCKSDF